MKCEQVVKNNLFEKYPNSLKKSKKSGILKIRGGILLYSKKKIQESKIRGGRWNTTKHFFF